MTTAIVLMGGLGLMVGVCLAIAAKVFYVYVDPKIVSIEEELPGEIQAGRKRSNPGTSNKKNV